MPSEQSTTQRVDPHKVQAEGSQVPPLLAELAPEQFAQWRHHPVTKLVLDDYLPHFARAIEAQVLAGWKAGLLSLQVEQQARGYVQGAELMSAVSIAQIRQFYGVGS